jgi:hypothetical protein
LLCSFLSLLLTTITATTTRAEKEEQKKRVKKKKIPVNFVILFPHTSVLCFSALTRAYVCISVESKWGEKRGENLMENNNFFVVCIVEVACSKTFFSKIK